MNNDRVVVTGIGMVTPLGAAADATAQAWRAGRSAPRAPLPDLAGTALETAEVAALPELDPARALGGRRMLKYMSEAAVLGCLAAREACSQARIQERFPPEQVGLYAGAGLAAASVNEVLPMIRESVDDTGHVSCRLLGERGLPRTNPLLSFKILANMPPCLVSILEGVKGPNFIFTPWEGQTAAALIEGWKAVATGQVDCALVGAADTSAHPAVFVYLKQSGRLAAGEFPASAAAYLVLERAATARRDGVQVHAQIDDLRTEANAAPNTDLLGTRMGRCFAAAPAVALALACLTSEDSVLVNGSDGIRFRATLRRTA